MADRERTTHVVPKLACCLCALHIYHLEVVAHHDVGHPQWRRRLSLAAHPRCHPVRREQRNRLAALLVGLVELREDAQRAVLVLTAGQPRGIRDSQLFRSSQPEESIVSGQSVFITPRVDEKKEEPDGYDGHRRRSLRGLSRLRRGKRAHFTK